MTKYPKLLADKCTAIGIHASCTSILQRDYWEPDKSEESVIYCLFIKSITFYSQRQYQNSLQKNIMQNIIKAIKNKKENIKQ